MKLTRNKLGAELTLQTVIIAVLVILVLVVLLYILFKGTIPFIPAISNCADKGGSCMSDSQSCISSGGSVYRMGSSCANGEVCCLPEGGLGRDNQNEFG
jgi:hypothetical protein